MEVSVLKNEKGIYYFLWLGGSMARQSRLESYNTLYEKGLLCFNGWLGGSVAHQWLPSHGPAPDRLTLFFSDPSDCIYRSDRMETSPKLSWCKKTYAWEHAETVKAWLLPRRYKSSLRKKSTQLAQKRSLESTMQSYEIKCTSPGVLGQLQTGVKEGSQSHPLRPPCLFTSNTADISWQ